MSSIEKSPLLQQDQQFDIEPSMKPTLDNQVTATDRASIAQEEKKEMMMLPGKTPSINQVLPAPASIFQEEEKKQQVIHLPSKSEDQGLVPKPNFNQMIKDREQFFKNEEAPQPVALPEPKKSKQPSQAKAKATAGTFLPPIKHASKKGLLPPLESSMAPPNPVALMDPVPGMGSSNAPLYPGSGPNQRTSFKAQEVNSISQPDPLKETQSVQEQPVKITIGDEEIQKSKNEEVALRSSQQSGFQKNGKEIARRAFNRDGRQNSRSYVDTGHHNTFEREEVVHEEKQTPPAKAETLSIQHSQVHRPPQVISRLIKPSPQHHVTSEKQPNSATSYMESSFQNWPIMRGAQGSFASQNQFVFENRLGGHATMSNRLVPIDDVEQSPFVLCSEVMKLLNTHPKFFGAQRVTRPPVMCWGDEKFTRDLLELGTAAIEKANKPAADASTEPAQQNYRFEIIEEAKGNGDLPDFVDEADRLRYKQLLSALPTVAEEMEFEHIRLMSVTWNLQGKLPTIDSLEALFHVSSVRHDIYVIGTQEAVRPIMSSMILPSKEKLDQLLLDYFNTGSHDFVMVNSISLAATHMCVIIRKQLAPYVTNVQNKVRACGIGDFLSNKGGVMISFNLGDQRLCFINCHLQAHIPSLYRRNNQWNQLNDDFVLQIEPLKDTEEDLKSVGCMPRKKKAGHINELRRLKRIEEQMNIDNFDAVIWLGDLNYRIQANDIFAVRRLIELDKWEELLKNDQLHLEKQIMRVAVGYNEGPIHFAPTFKFSAGSQVFNTKREPSWTDRIIFRSKDRLLKQISYDSNNNVMLSDHRPVFSQFLLKFKGDPLTLENRMTQARESIKKKKKEKQNSVLPFNPTQAPTSEEQVARIPTFDESNHQYTEIIENMKHEIPNFNSSKSKACEIF